MPKLVSWGLAVFDLDLDLDLDLHFEQSYFLLGTLA